MCQAASASDSRAVDNPALGGMHCATSRLAISEFDSSGPAKRGIATKLLGHLRNGQCQNWLHGCLSESCKSVPKR